MKRFILSLIVLILSIIAIIVGSFNVANNPYGWGSVLLISSIFFIISLIGTIYYFTYMEDYK